MSIDEAIAKQRKIAETQRLLYEACILKEQNTHFLRQAQEHLNLKKKRVLECNKCPVKESCAK